MFEHTPPGFDERVGKRNLGSGKHSFQESGIDQLVNRLVEVLDTSVDQQLGFPSTTCFEAVRRSSAVTLGLNVAETFQASMRRE